jgi:hypothetical protein
MELRFVWLNVRHLLTRKTRIFVECGYIHIEYGKLHTKKYTAETELALLTSSSTLRIAVLNRTQPDRTGPWSSQGYMKFKVVLLFNSRVSKCNGQVT